MEAQWELVKSFEDFLSEVEKSLEDLLPVEADLPKLDRQRTAIEVRAVCDGRESKLMLISGNRDTERHTCDIHSQFIVILCI